MMRIRLTNADLSQASLGDPAEYSAASLREADLQGAKLRRAILFQVDLQGANLRGAQITSEQLAQVGSLQGTILPDGTRHFS
jgi:uncharacterized protein YjbI with pentapeptide repeats